MIEKGLKMNRIEEALNQYKLIHTPVEFSVYANLYTADKYSSIDYLSLTESEQEKFRTRFESSVVTFINNVKLKTGIQGTLYNLLEFITNPNYEHVEKSKRWLVYSSYNGERPIGSDAYELWNGFQVIDMDIKDRAIATFLKQALFDKLNRYNWFLGVTFSSSGKGLHLYTKIRHSSSQKYDLKTKKIIFHANFRHKYSFVYLALLKIIENQTITNDTGEVVEITRDDLKKWLDFAMFRPAQGAFIGYDPHPLFSTNFFEDYIYVNFDNIEDLGHPDIDWITYPDLREIFSKHEYFESKSEAQEQTIEILSSSEPTFDNHNKIHYKHFERWRLANTLVKLYGEQQAFKYLRRICSDKVPTNELQGICSTAARYDKNIEMWAINQLNKYHGFNIKINQDQEPEDFNKVDKIISDLTDPTIMKRVSNDRYHEIKIKADEYLGTISNKILKICKQNRITLLEAGAGVGKTEMIKQLVREGKHILLIMPFTSTLEAKIEGTENWTAFFANRRVNLNASRGIAMTVDKFTRINPLEIEECRFDYIVVDESHLIFQSKYRPVMAKLLDIIKMSEMRFILMSGTPIGETAFITDIFHLKIIKEQKTRRVFTPIITARPIDNLIHMCRQMADDIIAGNRIFFPTNKGRTFEHQVEAIVNYFLDKQHFDRRVKIFYYKKSSNGDQRMNDINFEKTIKDLDILMCSTFLSVGVDILDKFDINIYFDQLCWIPQEIEQFANRLRSHDLFIRLYINNQDSDGNIIGLTNFKPYNFKLDDDEIKDIHSIIRICNASVERHPIDYNYNPITSKIITGNPYIEYNELENRYYLNETAFKVVVFEDRYRDYAQQLPVLIKGMQSYGYEIDHVRELGEYKGNISEDYIITDDIKNLIKQIENTRSVYQTVMIDELLDEISEDKLETYRAVMRGEYDIRKGEQFKEVITDSNKIMYVKDIEIFEKIVPLFTSFIRANYSVSTTRDIFEHCITSKGSYNLAAVHRIRQLVRLIYNNKQERLDFPIKDFMMSSYKFAEDHPKCQKSDLDKFLNDKVLEYLESDSTVDVVIKRSPLTVERLTHYYHDLFKCMVDVSRPRKDPEYGSKTISLSQISLIWKDRGEEYDSFIEYISDLDDLLELNTTQSKITTTDLNQ